MKVFCIVSHKNCVVYILFNKKAYLESPLYKGGGLIFNIFPQMVGGRVQIFPIKKEGLIKWGGVQYSVFQRKDLVLLNPIRHATSASNF